MPVQRRRQWQPTPALFPGKAHGRRSLIGCSPWHCGELNTTKGLPFHFPLSCIGEGNGNPLQCSCLEDPRDGGAWWAGIYGVAQSRTGLKRLSSSSINIQICCVPFMCQNGKPCSDARFPILFVTVFNLVQGIKWFCLSIYCSDKAFLWIRMTRNLVDLQVIWHYIQPHWGAVSSIE